jgi:flagellar motor component MotA
MERWMRIIGIIIIIGMVIGAVISIDHTKFLDLPSMLIVIGGAMGYVLA